MDICFVILQYGGNTLTQKCVNSIKDNIDTNEYKITINSKREKREGQDRTGKKSA